MLKQTPLPPWALLAGDALVLLAVTLVGFANHNASLADGRWLTTFVPLGSPGAWSRHGWAIIPRLTGAARYRPGGRCWRWF